MRMVDLYQDASVPKTSLTAHERTVLTATSVPADAAGRQQMAEQLAALCVHPALKEFLLRLNLYRIVRQSLLKTHCSDFREEKRLTPTGRHRRMIASDPSARTQIILSRDMSFGKTFIGVFLWIECHDKRAEPVLQTAAVTHRGSLVVSRFGALFCTTARSEIERGSKLPTGTGNWRLQKWKRLHSLSCCKLHALPMSVLTIRRARIRLARR
jgi:hypothetical protein